MNNKFRILAIAAVLALVAAAIVALHHVDPMGVIRRLHGMD
jgi:hypothetical protein